MKTKDKQAISQEKAATWTCFDEFPISTKLKRGLAKNKLIEPTEIQSEAVPVAIQGSDILGAAKTGSGKTVAFLIPVLARLEEKGWCKWDGLGALIISPTRELALQTYDVLKKIGKFHDFSAALIIGGTPWEFEKERISQTNIVIGTPGRILQHMDENPLFNATSLEILVLDEADRILDLGFQQQINAIIENLPPDRQTLLFSATQTRSVKDLARLSLKKPVYVSVHEHSAKVTPEKLVQSYVVCEDHNKLNLLWSFLKNHKQKKVIVFLTSCKQVRFFYEAFRRMKPGMIVSGLYGTMNPMKRLEVYNEFCKKATGTLLATDVAARGLDFPAVDWVVQLDCPPDANEYIHRSGRTARLSRDGEALLVLTPTQEKPMLEQLLEKKVPPLSKIEVNVNKVQNVTRKLEAYCAKDADLKSFAQKCFVSYVRSIYLMRNKSVFNVESVHAEELAKSFGLPFAPRVRFLRKKGVKFANERSDANSNERLEDVSAETCDRDSDEEFLTVSKRDVFGFQGGSGHFAEEQPIDRQSHSRGKPVSKEAAGRKLLKKKKSINKKVVFEDPDAERKIEETDFPPAPEKPIKGEVAEAEELTGDNLSPGLDIEAAKEKMKEVDLEDRKTYRERIKARKWERKLKKKLAEAERKNRPVHPKLGATLDIPVAESSDEETEPFEEIIKPKRRRLVDNSDLKTANHSQDISQLNREEEIALKLLGV